MSKFLVVFKREYAQVVKKKSFIAGIFLTPVLMAALVMLPAFLARQKASETEHLAVIDQSGCEIGAGFAKALERYFIDDEETVPYYAVERIFELDRVDSSGRAAVEDSLRRLINDKELKYFLVVGEGTSGGDADLYLVTNSDNFRSISRFEQRLSDLLSARRLEKSNVNLSIDSVLSLTQPIDLTIQDAKGESIPFMVKYFSALVFVGIMFGMMIGYGQLVMRSVIEEKNSRIMEVLISSVSPFQLMLGKIMGLGAATLTQVAIWFALGAVMFMMRSAVSVDPSIDRIVFDPVIIVFFILFLVSGYLLFSTLFALVGSIVNTEKEAQNFVAPITILMVLPFLLGIAVVQEPNSTLAVVLSLFPFTAPTMMMMRVVFIAPTVTEHSLFSGIAAEATLSFLIVVAAVAGMIWLTSRIFRVGILMYGKRPTLPEIIKWVKY